LDDASDDAINGSPLDDAADNSEATDASSSFSSSVKP
jgi:hypothetical protein